MYYLEFGFCNESYTTSIYGNHTWPETALTNSSGFSVSLSCNFRSGSVTRICRVTGWDAPDYSQCGSSENCEFNHLIQKLLAYCNTALEIFALFNSNNLWNSFDCMVHTITIFPSSSINKVGFIAALPCSQSMLL